MKDVKRQQFEFQRLADGSLSCVYFPDNKFVKEKSFLCIAHPQTKIYELLLVCQKPNPDWFNLNYLAYLIEKYNNQVITTI